VKLSSLLGRSLGRASTVCFQLQRGLNLISQADKQRSNQGVGKARDSAEHVMWKLQQRASAAQ
jgi:hypothetical protein